MGATSTATATPQKNGTGANKPAGGQRTSGTNAAARRSASGARRPAVQQQSRRSSNMLIAIPLISIIILFWMIFLNMGIVDLSESIGIDNDQWFMLSVLIILSLFIIMVLSTTSSVLNEPASSRRSVSRSASGNRGVIIEAVPEDKEAVAKSAEVKAEALPVKTEPAADTAAKADTETPIAVEEVKESKKSTAASKPALSSDAGTSNILEYPSSVSGGLYGDSYIKIDKNRILKLRSLIIEDYYLM